MQHEYTANHANAQALVLDTEGNYELYWKEWNAQRAIKI
jgi:hypothetical protein